MQMVSFQQLFHKIFGSYAEKEQIQITMALFQQPFHTSIGSCTGQEHVPM